MQALPAHWAQLAEAYNGRAYHNLQHAADVRNWVARLGGAPATLLAGWYHDAVYDPRASDNEDQSAGLAREHIAEAGGAFNLADEVCRLILVTAKHLPDTADPEGQVISDADLAML